MEEQVHPPLIHTIRRTIKHSAIYGLGNVSTKLVGIVLLPLYTKWISVAEYGVLGLLELLSRFGFAVFSMGITTAFFRWYGLSEDEQERRRIVFTSILFLCITNAVVIVLLSMLRGHLSQWLFSDERYNQAIVIVLCDVGLTTVLAIPRNLLRLQERSALYCFSTVTRLTVALLLNIYFVAVRRWGVEGVVVSQLLSSLFLSLSLAFYVGRNVSLRFMSGMLGAMLRYGAPLILASMSSILLNLGDRYVLKALSSLQEVGLYTLGYKVSGVVNMLLVQAFTLSFFPIIWNVVHRPDANVFFSRILTYFSFVVCWGVLGISLFSRELIEMFARNSAYWGGYRVVFPLAFSYFLIGVIYIFNTGLYLSKKTSHILVLTAGAALFNILLNILLVPLWGMMGAAVTTVLSYGALAVATYHVAQRSYLIPYDLKRVLILCVVSAALYGVSLGLSIPLPGWIFVAKLGLLMSYPFILYFIGFYEPVEIRGVRHIAGQALGKIRG